MVFSYLAAAWSLWPSAVLTLTNMTSSSITDQRNTLATPMLQHQHLVHKQPHQSQQQHCGSPFDRQHQALQSPTASSSSAAAGDHGDSFHDDEVDAGRQQQQLCAGCRRPISERYLLRAVDRYWHEDCLKCSCCDCCLGEVGSTLYTKADLLLCRRDYLRQVSRHVNVDSLSHAYTNSFVLRTARLQFYLGLLSVKIFLNLWIWVLWEIYCYTAWYVDKWPGFCTWTCYRVEELLFNAIIDTDL